MTQKFHDRYITASGAERAFVDLTALKTLWFNTGTLCNIECAHCYIESSPTNNRLSYLRAAELTQLLDEAGDTELKQVGFTGGEPFMNPQIIEMLGAALSRGFEVLVLTNAMQPMMRPRIQLGLKRLKRDYGADRLILRVSVDHHRPALHDRERGAGAWQSMLKGLIWLSQEGFRIHIAARKFSDEVESVLRDRYRDLLRRHQIMIDESDPDALVFFPEMDERADVPEITTACWQKLSVNPDHMMCASSRMVVKRRGAAKPVVMACTLLPYQEEFEMGSSLREMKRRVWLNHQHCARFCVLGGGSCARS